MSDDSFAPQNLGLGVLEEKRPGDSSSSSDSSESDDDDAGMTDQKQPNGTQAQLKSKGKDVLGHLMGQRKKRRPESKPVIEEVDI